MANSRSKPKASKVRFEETKDKNDGSSSVKITFSFESFLGQDSKGNGQDLEKWQEDKILSNLLYGRNGDLTMNCENALYSIRISINRNYDNNNNSSHS